MNETTEVSPAPELVHLKQDWIQKMIQKAKKSFENEETRRMVQVFIVDPCLQYLFAYLFPYIMLICVLFTVLTVLLAAVLLILFRKVGASNTLV